MVGCEFAAGSALIALTCVGCVLAAGSALIDLMTRFGEPAPDASGSQKTLCRHPFQEKMRTYVSPSKVVNLHRVSIWGHPGQYRGTVAGLKVTARARSQYGGQSFQPVWAPYQRSLICTCAGPVPGIRCAVSEAVVA